MCFPANFREFFTKKVFTEQLQITTFEKQGPLKLVLKASLIPTNSLQIINQEYDKQ